MALTIRHAGKLVFGGHYPLCSSTTVSVPSMCLTVAVLQPSQQRASLINVHRCSEYALFTERTYFFAYRFQFRLWRHGLKIDLHFILAKNTDANDKLERVHYSYWQI